MPSITGTEEGRAMLERVEQQFAEAQKRNPRILRRVYPKWLKLPVYSVALREPRMLEEK